MRLLVPGVFVLICALMAAPVASSIRFEEIAAKAGLGFASNSSPTPNKNQPETMVAGVGLLDYDNDGYLDVYLVNGAAIPSLKKEGPQYWNRLYHNNHDGTFTDVTEKAGLAGEGYGMGVAIGDYDNDGWPDIFVVNVTKNQLFHNNHDGTFTDVTEKAGLAGEGYGMGVAVGDYDNDGWPDIFVVNVTKNQLFHNNRDGTFTDVTEKAGLAGAMHDGKKMWSVSAGWFDYDNDGHLDLFVSNYCKWDVNKDPVCGPQPGIRAYCHPKNYAALPNTIYRNNGDGTFTDVSTELGIDKFYGKGMGVAFADYDHDGFTDVFVANDNSANALFHNLKGKKFEEVALQSGVAYPESGSFISGMGADFKDIDNDGFDDIWHTAIEGESFPLFRNNKGSGDFSEITNSSGLGHPTRQMSGWSNGIFDFDNDGWKDLFVARGNVLDNIAMMSQRKYEEPNTIFRNLGKGKFQEVDAGPDLAAPAAHRGVAFGDMDNDGRIDAIVSVLNGKVKYFHNVSETGNHWLLLKLTGVKSNRMGLGAQIAITGEDGMKQYNHATTSTGYACSSDPRVHFGLGAAKVVKEIEIKWPSGVRQTLHNVPADQILAVTEQAGETAPVK